MTREEFYSSDRRERELYNNCTYDSSVIVPLTRDGFEALVEKAASYFNLIIDDPVRSLVAGFIHHIPADENTLEIGKLATAMHKGISNNLTFQIDQEMKLKAKAEFEAKNNDTNVIPMNKDSNGPQATS